MRERLDRVHVATSNGSIEIPWETRDQILDPLRKRRDALPITRSFDAVGGPGARRL